MMLVKFVVYQCSVMCRTYGYFGFCGGFGT
jgi:hypothetical protein